MSRLTVILGQPATGKTTLRQSITADASLCIDEYRAKGESATAWERMVNDADRHLRSGHTVVLEGCRFTIELHHLLKRHDHELILCAASRQTREARLRQRALTDRHIASMLNEPAPTTRRHTLVVTDPDLP